MSQALVGQEPAACFESRVGDVVGRVYIRCCELAGRRQALDLPVDPLIDNLALRVLGRVVE
jgi:hypothetical protein